MRYAWLPCALALVFAGCGGGTKTVTVNAGGSGGAGTTAAGDPVASLRKLIQETQSTPEFNAVGFKTSGLVTASFVNKIDNYSAKAKAEGGVPGLDFDPFLCAQQVPTKTTYDTPRITGNTATVVAHHHFGGPKTYGASTTKVTYNMKFVGGTWRLDSDTCLK